LEEVDPPSRVADHLVASGILLERVHVDETVEVILSDGVHLAQKNIFIRIK